MVLTGQEPRAKMRRWQPTYFTILGRSGTIAILIEDLSEYQSCYIARHGSMGTRI